MLLVPVQCLKKRSRSRSSKQSGKNYKKKPPHPGEQKGSEKCGGEHGSGLKGRQRTLRSLPPPPPHLPPQKINRHLLPTSPALIEIREGQNMQRYFFFLSFLLVGRVVRVTKIAEERKVCLHTTSLVQHPSIRGVFPFIVYASLSPAFPSDYPKQ